MYPRSVQFFNQSATLGQNCCLAKGECDLSVDAQMKSPVGKSNTRSGDWGLRASRI